MVAIPSRGPSKAAASQMARDAVAVIESGAYTAPSGARVDIREAIARAVAGTREIRPDDAIPTPERAGVHARLESSQETSLACAARLGADGERVLVLNFASAKNPGGGFLNGARAQEESLARASALYACLSRREMYAHHRASHDAMYTDWCIYSPDVPVFRDDAGAWLETPQLVSFLTSPAPNAGVVLEREPGRAGEVLEVLSRRAARVLAIARAFGHTRLVLGAWGCGVFGNDPEAVADTFDAALRGPFAGCFEHVVFAVYDTTQHQRNYGPFARRWPPLATDA